MFTVLLSTSRSWVNSACKSTHQLNDTLIFQRPYKLNDMELVLVKTQIEELLEVGLVELS
jgi:hypothetical protein